MIRDRGREASVVVRRAVATARERQASLLAAGLAYYAFNTVVPALLLVVVVLSAVGRLEATVAVVASAIGTDAGQLTRVLDVVSTTSTGRVRTAVIAGVVFLWSTGRFFEAVQTAVREMYGADGYDSTTRKLVDIGVAFGAFVVPVLALPAVAVAFEFVLADTARPLVTPVAVLTVLFAGFVPLYARLPRADASVREALPGAVFAAVAWTLSGVGFQFYAAASRQVELYGVAGWILLVLSWFYVGGLVVLVGAALNAATAGHLPETGGSVTHE